jgi:hypothetical protein
MIIIFILGLSTLLFACTTSTPTEDDEVQEITLTDPTEVNTKAMSLYNDCNYTSFSATQTQDETVTTFRVSQQDDLSWIMVSVDDYVYEIYKDGDAYIEYNKSVEDSLSVEDVNYITKEEANNYDMFDLVVDNIFDYFESDTISLNRELISQYYGESIDFVYSCSYYKNDNSETLTISTSYLIDDYTMNYPVYTLGATIIFDNDILSNVSISNTINEKCLYNFENIEDSDEICSTMEISFYNIGNTIVPKPILEDTAMEYVGVDFYIGDEIIDNSQYEYGTTLTSSDIISEYANNGEFGDTANVSVKLKSSPIIEDSYILDEKTSYAFEFILDPSYEITYVSNMSDVAIPNDYFDTTGYINYDFEQMDEIIDGKYFYGWYEDSEFTIEASDTYIDNITLYGKWVDVNYVTIINDNESVIMPKYPCNVAGDLPKGVEIGENIIEGYFTDVDFTTAFEGAEENIDYTVYVKFAASKYITFDFGSSVEDIDNYIGTIDGNTIKVNYIAYQLEGNEFSNLLCEMDSMAYNFNIEYLYWTLNGETKYNASDYPDSEITLSAVYDSEVLINIDFGEATIDETVLTNRGYIYTVTEGIYEFDFSAYRQDGTYNCIDNLMTIFDTTDGDIVTEPTDMVFDKFTTDAELTTEATLSAWPTAEITIYAVYKTKAILSLDMGGQTLSTGYDSYYDSESGLYVIDNSLLIKPTDIDDFLTTVLADCATANFLNWTTDIEGTTVYEITDWETITIYAQFTEEG